jgi:two-component system OmpR family sensor kinase
MGLLVDDLLLLARLDQQRPLSVGPVDLVELVSDAVLDARAVAPDRVVDLDVTDVRGPVFVNGDESRLRQVLGNLTSNALTHTPAGTPVSVILRSGTQSATIDVRDQGPGLSPEAAERVFERFYRVDQSRSRRTGDDHGPGCDLPSHAAVDEPSAGGRGRQRRACVRRLGLARVLDQT